MILIVVAGKSNCRTSVEASLALDNEGEHRSELTINDKEEIVCSYYIKSKLRDQVKNRTSQANLLKIAQAVEDNDFYSLRNEYGKGTLKPSTLSRYRLVITLSGRKSTVTVLDPIHDDESDVDAFCKIWSEIEQTAGFLHVPKKEELSQSRGLGTKER